MRKEVQYEWENVYVIDTSSEALDKVRQEYEGGK